MQPSLSKSTENSSSPCRHGWSAQCAKKPIIEKRRPFMRWPLRSGTTSRPPSVLVFRWSLALVERKDGAPSLIPATKVCLCVCAVCMCPCLRTRIGTCVLWRQSPIQYLVSSSLDLQHPLIPRFFPAHLFLLLLAPLRCSRFLSSPFLPLCFPDNTRYSIVTLGRQQRRCQQWPQQPRRLLQSR